MPLKRVLISISNVVRLVHLLLLACLAFPSSQVFLIGWDAWEDRVFLSPHVTSQAKYSPLTKPVAPRDLKKVTFLWSHYTNAYTTSILSLWIFRKIVLYFSHIPISLQSWEGNVGWADRQHSDTHQNAVEHCCLLRCIINVSNTVSVSGWRESQGFEQRPGRTDMGRGLQALLRLGGDRRQTLSGHL